MEARHAEGTFAGAGGVDVYWQAWLPAGRARAIVLIAHGAAEHSGRYAWTAGQLTARGHAVYAIDHRGHGRSAGQRAYVDRVDNAVADLHALSDLARERHAGAAVFLLGHSMGGLISLSYALSHQDELTGMVLSAPLAVLEANPATRSTTAARCPPARSASWSRRRRASPTGCRSCDCPSSPSTGPATGWSTTPAARSSTSAAARGTAP